MMRLVAALTIFICVCITVTTLSAAVQPSNCPLNCSCQISTMWDFLMSKMKEVNEEYETTNEHNPIIKVLEKLKPSFQLFPCLNIHCIVYADGCFDLSESVKEAIAQWFFVTINVTCPRGALLNWTDTAPYMQIAGLAVHGCSLQQTTSISLQNPTNLMEVDISNVGKKWFRQVEIFSSGLTNLYKLRLQKNNLTEFPIDISGYGMYNMRILDLKNNNLDSIDCALIDKYVNLVDINLDNNLIKTIPSCITQHSSDNHAKLHLRHNQITDLASWYEPNRVTTSLWGLYLNYNKITKLNRIASCNLQILHLSHNRIEYMESDAFWGLKYLLDVDLSYNSLSYIESGTFKGLPIMDRLDLSGNKLMVFSDSVLPLFLGTLNISDNQLLHPIFHEMDYQMPFIREIYSKDNPYRCDCSNSRLNDYLSKANITGFYYPSSYQSTANGKYRNLSLSTNPFRDIQDFKCATPKKWKDGKLLDHITFTTVCPVVDDCPFLCHCNWDKTFNLTNVHCENHNLTTLPSEMPQGNLSIYLQNNKLETITDEDYFSRVQTLYLSNNSIETITSRVFWYISHIHLDGNNLKSLPQDIESAKGHTIASLALGHNPWVCTCESMWLKAWFLKKRKGLAMDAIICTNEPVKGRLMTEITEDMLHCRPHTYIQVAVSLGVLLVLTFIVIAMLYRYRFEVKVILHSRFNWHPFDRDIEMTEKKYDAFISYSSEDREWVHTTLAPTLENKEPPYHLCMHCRDFMPGETIDNNIIQAIQDSRCTILVLTDNFLQSNWCVFEFQQAHYQMIHNPNFKLIVILKEEVSAREDMDDDLRAYLRTHTYLEIRDKWFWKKLLYVMPTIHTDNERAYHTAQDETAHI